MQTSDADSARKWVESPGRMPVPAAVLSAFLLVTLVHAAVMSFRLPGPPSVWLGAQYFAAGQYFLFGLGAALLAALWVRGPARLQYSALLLLVVLASVILRFALEEDASGPAEKMSQWLPEQAVYWLFGVLGASALVGAFIVGRALTRSGLRVAAAVFSVGFAAANGALLPLSYPGMHAIVALVATSLLAGVLARGPSIWPLSRREDYSWLRPWVFGAVGALFTLPTLWVTPKNPVLIALLRQPAAVFAPAVALWRAPLAGETHIPAAKRQWFVDRAELQPTLPTEPPLPTKIDRVILLGVDSMRADLLEDESFRERLPEFFRLRDESVWFDNARAPGASTAPSLSALFAGVHYSQLYWSLHKRRRPELFPHEDDTPRFPELLAKDGVHTTTVDTAGWLTNTFGIVRGFTEEKSARKGRPYPSAKQAFGFFKSQIDKHMKDENARQFAFVHFLDAHAPYTSAGKAKTPFDGYVAELGLVDRELGRLRRYLTKRGRTGETAIIVFSDHGEAFGEHGLTWHASSLYDSMIRVPLLIYVPGLPPRRVHTPVTVLDIGPTILDIFSLPTPSHFMGESLVETLRGGSTHFTRPILAEARLKRALIDEDFKLIYDTRAGTLEMFNLAKDPGETRNLYQEGEAQSHELQGTLTAYFTQHTHRRPGYKVPYRKW